MSSGVRSPSSRGVTSGSTWSGSPRRSVRAKSSPISASFQAVNVELSCTRIPSALSSSRLASRRSKLPGTRVWRSWVAACAPWMLISIR